MQTNRRIRDNCSSSSLTDSHAKLTRLVLASMLFEKQYYIDGADHAKLVASLVSVSDPKFVQALAIKARTEYKLRHIPLFLCRELARTNNLDAATLNAVIQRPDEITEFLAIYWAEKRSPVSNQVKKGLALAFGKFNEYQLAKYDKNNSVVSLRDVMFLCHPKPKTADQEALFKRVANRIMVTPYTWETELSAGSDKAQTFINLMDTKKLGALAFLRNLRNMTQAGVPIDKILVYSALIDVSKVLPFRYLAAARIVPELSGMLEAMMLRSLKTAEKLPGKTILLVDVSGSMFGAKVSAKSDLDRFDAAAALAVLCASICENVEIYTFSNTTQFVPLKKGFALVEALRNSQPASGTAMGSAVSIANRLGYDRLIVITDEQTRDRVPKPESNKAYILNVGANKNGVEHSEYTTITGFSEAVIEYIRVVEQE